MSERWYFASGEKEEVELNRLRLLEGLYDPTTIRHLEMIGVAEGWSCLEVGAGAGSVAQWLSTHVGPAGRARLISAGLLSLSSFVRAES